MPNETNAMEPRRVGQYELYEDIASGGMATVRFARFVNELGLGRLVAVKCLHPGFAKDEAFSSALIEEAKLALRVRHTNVVATLDAVARDGEVFLVMDYVHGVSLAELLKRLNADGESVPASIAASIMVGVLEGIHAAHEATSAEGIPLCIVHRDVSPQNVLVDTDGIARVFDFGVAKAFGRAQNTQDGVVKGKTGYMSPEQFMRDEVDRRTDVFAASVVFWEMLTGTRLFPEVSLGAVYRRMLEPQIAAASTLVDGLSVAYDSVVSRGLAQTAEDRFPTARAMATAVEEAGPIASQREVGAWVAQLASDNLKLRSIRIAQIEKRAPLPVQQKHLSGPPAALMEPSEDKPTWMPPRRVDAHVSGDPLSLDEEAPPSDAVNVSTHADRAEGRVSAHAAPRRALPWRWLAIGVVSLVGVIAWMVLFRSNETHGPNLGAGGTAPSSSMLNLTAASSVPEHSLGPAAASASAVPAMPSATGPTSSAAIPAEAKTAPRLGTARPPKVPAPAVKKPPANCSPPYFIDGRGVRVLKPECL